MRRLPPITLIADLSEEPATWKPAFFIPFGAGVHEVGGLLTKRLASQPVVPPSFAIDRDGSLWLLDLVKHRIVHYGRDGRYIGQVGGLEFNRFRPYAQDVGFAGNRLYVHEFTHTTLQVFLRTVTPAGISRRLRVESAGHPLRVAHLVSPQPELVGWSEGRSGVNGNPPQGGPTGYHVIDATSGVATHVLGAMLADGTRLGIGPEGGNENTRVILHHEVGGEDRQTTIRLRVQPAGDPDDEIRVTASWQGYAALPNGLAVYVQFAPLRVVDEERSHGPTRWLLEYFDDGEPLVWEPIPDSPLEGAYIWRHLAQGLDGHLYLMLAEKEGMRVYRRPGPPD